MESRDVGFSIIVVCDRATPYLLTCLTLLLTSFVRCFIKPQLMVFYFPPFADNLPCLVLQYADDTIIIIRSSEDDIRNLKVVLDSFSMATGLHINFHKSTFAPVHVDPDVSIHLAAILGCTVASFPQTYLGLPLYTHKLKLNAFRPYLAEYTHARTLDCIADLQSSKFKHIKRCEDHYGNGAIRRWPASTPTAKRRCRRRRPRARQSTKLAVGVELSSV
jgi:hypothetical protein